MQVEIYMKKLLFAVVSVLIYNFSISQCKTIYVEPSPTGSNLGTKANPAQLGHALSVLAQPGDHLKLAQGTYTISSAITAVANDITIEGGFDKANNWEKTSQAGVTIIERTTSNVTTPTLATARLSAFELTNVSGLRLQDLKIVVQNAPAATTYGISTYGVYLSNCSNYQIVRCEIIAGNASKGLDGVNGGFGVWGNTGANGWNGSDDDKWKVDGGYGGSGGGGTIGGSAGQGRTSEGPGYAGGNGGTASNYRNGGGGGGGGGGGREDQNGGNGGYGGGVAGLVACPAIILFPFNTSGGIGGVEDNCNPASANGCVDNLSGTDGANGLNGTNGCNGTNGAAGSKMGFWNAGAKGTDGTYGQGGQGGKGGGGGAGEGGTTCTNGTGAGGGGGGGGGQGGGYGTGGYGGGSSYAIYLDMNGANGSIDQCNLISGTAGAGGAGGIGGDGGLGRTGGLGGTIQPGQDYEVGCGGKGGKGGDGGKGGNGGNGIAGEALTIYVGGTALVSQDIGFNLAAQPVIKVAEEFCAGQKVNFTASIYSNWQFDNVSNPSSALGTSVSTVYETSGRKNIIYGAQTYKGFAYITNLSPSIANAGKDSTVCNNINLYANTPTQGVGTWTILTPGTVVSSINNPASPVTLIVGLNRLVWTISYGSCCPDTKDTVEITLQTANTNPLGILASKDTLCVGDSSILTINGGSLGTGAIWKWYNDSCGGVLVGTGDTLIVFPVNQKTYYLRAEGVCDSTLCVSKTIYVHPSMSPPTGITATADTLCFGSGSITLTAQGTAPTLPAQWFWYTDSCGGTLVGTGNSITVTPAKDTVYYLRKETPGSGPCTKTFCVSKFIKVVHPDTNAIAIQSSADTICPGDTVILTPVGGGIGDVGKWAWYSGSCGSNLQGYGDTLEKAPTVTTTYYLRTEGYCGTSTCVSKTIVVQTISTAPTSILYTDDTLCRNDSVTLTVFGGTLAPGDTWHWYESSCGGIFVDTGYSITVAPQSNVTYFVRGEGASCKPGDCVSKIIYVKGEFVAVLPFDTLCGVLQPVTLVQGIPVGGTYSGPGVTGNQFDPVAAGYGSHRITYTFIDNPTGCVHTAYDTLVVESNCGTIDKLLVINTFTPNGDGMNDTWNLNLTDYTDINLLVFNKWGSTVFQSSSPIIQWDGTYQGKPLPVGSYFYMLTLDGEVYKGDITIVR